MIDKSNADARGALHKFSDMLRYQLYEMNGEYIPIEKEIRYLEDYISLQKLRKDEHYHFEFNCDPAVKGFMIPPLLLIPFVENAFKHISHHKEKENMVKIDLRMEGETFHFSIVNSKDAIGQSTDKQGGIGLANVTRRLALLYPGKHRLEIKNEPEQFFVNLMISIQP